MVMPNELMQGGLPPPDLAQMVGASMTQGGPPPGAAGPPGLPEQGSEAPDPLEAVQTVVQDLHHLMTVLPDPQMTNIAATCLTNMTKVQTMLMGQGAGGGGGGGGSY